MSTPEFDLYVAGKMRNKAQNAKDRNIPFELTFQGMKNLLSAKKCYYTGIELTRPSGQFQKATDLTIDRIDATKGYVKGNVVACCYAANQIKSMAEGGGIQGLKVAKRIFEMSIKRIKENG